MDCAGLRSDIGRLREEVSALEANSKKMRESGATSKNIRGVMGLIESDTQDLILKKYLEDFREQNPEIFPILSLGKRVEIKDYYGWPAGLSSITDIGHGHVLIGGYGGVLYEGFYGDRNELILGERIQIRNYKNDPADIQSIVTTDDGHVLIGGDGVFFSGFYDDQMRFLDRRFDIKDANGKPADIFSFATTDDGRVLIGGNNGVLYSGFFDEHGELALGERIDIKDANGKAANIRSITIIDDGHVLIGGLRGALYVGSYNNEEFVLGERVDIINTKGEPASIFSTAVTEDGHVLIGGNCGMLIEGVCADRGKLILGNERMNIEDEDPDGGLASIHAITATKDGYVLVGSSAGALYVGSYDDQGKLMLGERIDVKNVKEEPVCIIDIAVTDDGHVLVGGDYGAFYSGFYYGASLEALKQRLPEIIEKGAAS